MHFPVGKMHHCCMQPGIQSNYARNYCKCNDLINYRDRSMTPAIPGMTVFVTKVYGYQLLPIVTKSSILDVSRVLNLSLKCSDLIKYNNLLRNHWWLSQLRILSAKLQASIIFINAFYFPGDSSSVHFDKQNRGEAV